MSRIESAITKFGLRNPVVLKCKNYVAGQKMDEECIQRFVQGDPSGNGKYIEWMFYQAGGGKDRLDRSELQWSKGEFNERPIREQLKEAWLKDELGGWTDTSGFKHPPVSADAAEAAWAEVEERWKSQHTYGDEDFSDVGFSFAQSWPGRSSIYERIVAAVQKFHKFQAKLKTLGAKLDLNLTNYPQLKDLEDVVSNLWALEIRNDIDAHKVYEDDNLVAWVPFTVGASLKYGIVKWCTSNDSNFSAVAQGNGVCRWKEYSSKNSLVYCTFKTNRIGTNWSHMAIQIPFDRIHCHDVGGEWEGCTFWDDQDVSHSLTDFRSSASNGSLGVKQSIKKMLKAVEEFVEDFPFKRMVCDFLKKYKHLVPEEVRNRARTCAVAQAQPADVAEQAMPADVGQQLYHAPVVDGPEPQPQAHQDYDNDAAVERPVGDGPEVAPGPRPY